MVGNSKRSPFPPEGQHFLRPNSGSDMMYPSILPLLYHCLQSLALKVITYSELLFFLRDGQTSAIIMLPSAIHSLNYISLITYYVPDPLPGIEGDRKV